MYILYTCILALVQGRAAVEIPAVRIHHRNVHSQRGCGRTSGSALMLPVRAIRGLSCCTARRLCDGPMQVVLVCFHLYVIMEIQFLS